MAQREKVDIGTTVKLTEQDKENVAQDMPRLNGSLAHLGIQTNYSHFVRLVMRDLHAKLENGETISWPPSLKTVRKKKR